jgi:hypothetical protein
VDRGYKRILARPEPLYHEITKEQLIAWYEKRGFTKMAGDRGIYLKNDFIGQSYPMPKT